MRGKETIKQEKKRGYGNYQEERKRKYKEEEKRGNDPPKIHCRFPAYKSNTNGALY